MSFEAYSGSQKSAAVAWLARQQGHAVLAGFSESAEHHQGFAGSARAMCLARPAPFQATCQYWDDLWPKVRARP
ncbi:hypothetical protein ACWX0P_31190 [Vibrio mediterranei]